MPLPFTVEQKARNVLNIRMDVRAGWEQWFLLSSDRHHDNAHTDHALERKHLELAKKRNAGILDHGDLFCCMQGKWDKRASKDALREELREGSYLDRVVEYNADFYKPYADHIVMIQPGNHETAMQRHHETNLTERLAERLRAPDGNYPGYPVKFGSYAGWVRFVFTINKTKRHSLWLYRHHGYGGGGAVTKGVIQTNRMAVYLPDATFVVTGHTHDKWILPLQRSRISSAGVPFQDTQWHIKCGGYKDEHSPSEGYHIEGGREPKPLGAVWLRFFAEADSGATGRVAFELTPTA